MNRRLLRWILLTSLAHAAIAVCSFGLMRLAERSGLSAFHNLERTLVFVDVPKYFEHANRTMAGQIPYRDYLVEYPILALPFLYAPRLMTSSQAAFVTLFACEMLAFEALLVSLVAWRVARTEGIEAVPRRLAWMTAFFACVCPFVIGRYDVVPAVFGFAAALAWFGGKQALGGFLAAIGTLVKIVPGTVAMIGFLGETRRFFCDRKKPGAAVVDPRGRPAWLVTWSGSFYFAAFLNAGLCAWFAIGQAGVVKSLRYHSERGIEIGSIPSGVLWLIAQSAHRPVKLVHDHDSLNLVTAGSEQWASVAIWVQAGLLVLVGLAFLMAQGRDPVKFAGAAILAFVIGGKVLSPQYLIWLMPFAVVMGGRAGRAARPLFLVASILTLILYPWAAGALRGLEIWAFLALNLRNLALLGVFLCWMGFPGDEAAEPSAICLPVVVP